MKISRCAPRIAASSAGKYSTPERSSVSRFPGRNSTAMPGDLLELQVRGKGGVVGQAPPHRPVVHVRVAHAESAHIDTVQTQHREGAREGAHRLAALVTADRKSTRLNS